MNIWFAIPLWVLLVAFVIFNLSLMYEFWKDGRPISKRRKQ